MSKLFLTGGTGFWGKNILELILQNNKETKVFDDIVVLTRNKDTFLKSYPKFDHSKITYINGDVRYFTSKNNDFNYIIHLATDANKDLNDNRPLEMMDVIINGTKNVLEFAQKQINLKKILFASSGGVYGSIPDAIKCVKEEERFDLDFNNPLNAYAQAKRTSEMMCIIFYEKYKIPIVIARGFAFVGKYLPQNTHFAIGNFIKQATENRKIIIKSDGAAKRSYMNADDLAQCLINLLLKEKNNHLIYNVGSDDGKTLKEWAEIIANTIGGVEIEVLGQKQEGYSAGNNYVPNIDRLKNEIEVKTKFNLLINVDSINKNKI